MLKSFYSRLVFKVIKYFANYPNFEEACKRFHYESGKPRELQKQIGLQCHLTIPVRVTIIHDNRIDFNENKNVFKYLNEVPPSDYWFPYEYIDAEVKKKVNKTKRKLADNEMGRDDKHYVESLNHNPNWLKTITIEIYKFLIDREYFNLFMKMYMQWIKDDGSTSSSRTLIIPLLPHFEKLVLSKLQLYIKS